MAESVEITHRHWHKPTPKALNMHASAALLGFRATKVAPSQAAGAVHLGRQAHASMAATLTCRAITADHHMEMTWHRLSRTQAAAGSIYP